MHDSRPECQLLRPDQESDQYECRERTTGDPRIAQRLDPHSAIQYRRHEESHVVHPSIRCRDPGHGHEQRHLAPPVPGFGPAGIVARYPADSDQCGHPLHPESIEPEQPPERRSGRRYEVLVRHLKPRELQVLREHVGLKQQGDKGARRYPDRRTGQGSEPAFPDCPHENCEPEWKQDVGLQGEQGKKQSGREVFAPDDRPRETREPQKQNPADLPSERDKQRRREGKRQPDRDGRSALAREQTPQHRRTPSHENDLAQCPGVPSGDKVEGCEGQKQRQSPRRIPHHAGIDEPGPDRALQLEDRVDPVGIAAVEQQSADGPVGDEVVHVGDLGACQPACGQPHDEHGTDKPDRRQERSAASSVRTRCGHSPSFPRCRSTVVAHTSLVRRLLNGKLRTMIAEIGSGVGTRAHEEGFRAGFVAMVGLPNVGKSTLVNALVGQRLSIVTPKAQTTRQRVVAIYTDAAHQAVFVDTPGLLEPRYLLQRGMREEAERAAVEANVVVYVVDVGYDRSIEHGSSWGLDPGVPALLCLNKIDRVSRLELGELHESFERGGRWESIIETRATHEEGIEQLRASVLDALPPGPALYPEDDVATAPVRFFAAELVRESCFEELGQELPYSIAVGIEDFRESEQPVFIGATIFVERESQKGMVIGRKGVMIRKIGTVSRHKLEALIERPVYLDLRVKVLRNWRRNPARLKLLGYPVPSRKA